jgi:hypothetical protein
MDRYLGEFAFRSDREMKDAMFDLLIALSWSFLAALSKALVSLATAFFLFDDELESPEA